MNPMAINPTGPILPRKDKSFKIKSAKKVATRLADSLCGVWNASSSLRNSGIHRPNRSESDFSGVRPPFFYYAENTDKSAIAGKIGRDVQRDPSKTRCPGKARTRLAMIF
jgi:hypothetical protein